MMEKMRDEKKRKGFTLIELIVVIAILGILAAILIPRFSGFQDKARSSEAIMHAKQIATAADARIVETGKTAWDATTTNATTMNNSEITTIAGPDITGVISDGSIDSNGRFLFKYTIDLPAGGTTFVVERTADGSFDVTY